MTSSQLVKPQPATAVTRQPRTILAYSLALMAQFLFCTSNYFLKRAQKNLSTAQAQYMFFLQLSVFGYGIASYKKYPLHFTNPFANKLLIVRAALGMINTYLVFYAFTLIPISDLTVIGTLGPPFGALLSTLIFGERFDKVILVTGITGVIGVIFIAKPAFLFGTSVFEIDAEKRALGVMISVFTAFLGATIGLFIKKCGALTHPFSQIVYFGTLTSLCMPLMLFWEGSKTLTGSDLLNMGVCGMAGLIAQICISNALQFGDAGKVGLFGYTQIIFAFMYEIVLDDRTPDTYSLIGTAIILSGFMMLVSKAVKRPSQTLPSKIENKPMPSIKA